MGARSPFAEAAAGGGIGVDAAADGALSVERGARLPPRRALADGSTARTMQIRR
eukprot:gene10857-21873_t